MATFLILKTLHFHNSSSTVPGFWLPRGAAYFDDDQCVFLGWRYIMASTDVGYGDPTPANLMSMFTMGKWRDTQARGWSAGVDWEKMPEMEIEPTKA